MTSLKTFLDMHVVFIMIELFIRISNRKSLVELNELIKFVERVLAANKQELHCIIRSTLITFKVMGRHVGISKNHKS